MDANKSSTQVPHAITLHVTRAQLYRSRVRVAFSPLSINSQKINLTSADIASRRASHPQSADSDYSIVAEWAAGRKRLSNKTLTIYIAIRIYRGTTHRFRVNGLRCREIKIPGRIQRSVDAPYVSIRTDVYVRCCQSVGSLLTVCLRWVRTWFLVFPTKGLPEGLKQLLEVILGGCARTSTTPTSWGSDLAAWQFWMNAPRQSLQARAVVLAVPLRNKFSCAYYSVYVLTVCRTARGSRLPLRSAPFD